MEIKNTVRAHDDSEDDAIYNSNIATDFLKADIMRNELNIFGYSHTHQFF